MNQVLRKIVGNTVAIALLTSVSATALALQPLITDDTGTQGAGGNQAEWSYARDRMRSDGENEWVNTQAAVYTRGLSETLDVYVGISHARIDALEQGSDVSGYGNPSIGAKWRFYENEESRTSLAIKPEAILPVSSGRESSGLGTGKTSGNLTLILTQEMPFGAIHFNAGVGRDRFRNTDENPDTTYRRASVAPVWDVSEQWKLALDMGIESARADSHSVRAKFVELGAIYSPNEDLDLALGLIRTSDNESPKSTTHSATAGVTWRF